MWPTEAFTMNSEPKYWEIVLAFAGDSTMTKEREPEDPAVAVV